MLQILRNTYKILRCSEDLCNIKSIRNGINVITNQTEKLNTRIYFSTSIPNENEENSTKTLDINTLTKGDSELEHKLQVIMLEVDVLRQEGKKVPTEEFMKQHHWEEILKLPTRTSRKKYIEYLFKLEKIKESRTMKKQQKKLFYEEKLAAMQEDNTEEEDSSLKYELGKNSIFLRVRESTMNQMYNNRLIQAMQFGQKLVVDCGYYDDMTSRENLNCAKQLTLLFAENRYHDDPFDLHLCNANSQSVLMKALSRSIPTIYDDEFPLNIHHQSYLDTFNKEQLVYLTPHCREELTDYDHDAIYIIGAIVDKINQAPLSLARAKKDKIRMAKFPLDKYLHWGSGSGKSLTLNQVTSILLDIKHTGDWEYALRHVPRRKIVSSNAGSAIENYSSLPYDRSQSKFVKQWRPSESQNINKAKSLRNINRTLLDMKEVMKE